MDVCVDAMGEQYYSVKYVQKMFKKMLQAVDYTYASYLEIRPPKMAL